MKVSVIIPTKNGGRLFAEVLDAISTQETPWPFEVVVIDSGSRDETLEICSAHPDVRLLQIPSDEFGHGRTRNRAIAQSGGEFIAMLTQDAKPANRHWLRELVGAVEQAPDVAGAFGRHLPYPGRDPFMMRDLALHFDNFARAPKIVRLDDPQRYGTDQGYRQVLHFFSDNNACLRRSVWERIPYPDVDFAEDQLWAKTIIEAGYAKAYADDARVFHSHEFGVAETLRRAYDEARAFRRLFGYCLCPTLQYALVQAMRCTVRDFRYLFSQRLAAQFPEWFVKLPFAHLSRQFGHFLGGWADKNSPMLDRIFSLDIAKKRQ